MFRKLVSDGCVTELIILKKAKTQSPPKLYVAREIAIRVHPPFFFWFCSSEHKSTAPLVSIVGSRPASAAYSSPSSSTPPSSFSDLRSPSSSDMSALGHVDQGIVDGVVYRLVVARDVHVGLGVFRRVSRGHGVTGG